MRRGVARFIGAGATSSAAFTEVRVPVAQAIYCLGVARTWLIAIALTGCRSVQMPEHAADSMPPVSADATSIADATSGADVVATIVDASTEDATAADAMGTLAAVELRPQKSHAIHEHGGDPAHLYAARFVAHNAGTRRASVSVVRVVFLAGNSCAAFPSQVRSSPKVDGISIGSGGAIAARVTVPPGDTPLTVEFAPVDAYYTHCNRFAFRVTFDVDGAQVQSTAETEVSRVDPLRHP